MLTKFTKKFHKVVNSIIETDDETPSGKKALPLHPRHDDLYLVSYPKSGTTWLNFIVANVNVLMSKVDEEVNVFNIHDFIPDIHYTKEIKNTRTSFPGYRVIKSHDSYNPGYKKIIYLVRDPRDTMVSYFHFAHGTGIYSGSISEFIRSPIYGITSWCSHLTGWFEDTPPELRIYFMRYEDMKKDTFNTLNSMYKILGHRVPESILQGAIELSSFSKMKESENAWAYGGRPSGRRLKFMRQGKSGTYVREMSKEDIDYINEKAGKVMEYFHYSLDRT